MKKKDKENIGAHLLELFRFGFEGMFLPRLYDTDFQGILTDNAKISSNASPLVVLEKGAQLIRSLLIQNCGQKIEVLPCLPVELHSGCFSGWETNNFSLSMEWSKKLIRKIIVYSKHDHSSFFKFQSNLKFFRVRKKLRDKGVVYSTCQQLQFSKNTTYIIDRFTK